jgi:hypothetical protein
MKSDRQWLSKKFGEAFARQAMRLPTLMSYIKDLREADVRIKLCDGIQAYYKATNRTIYIGREAPRNYALVSIGHEYSHALIRPTIHPKPGITGRQEFIESCLEDEAEAIIHELKVLREMLKAGMRVAQRDMGWYYRYRHGGGRANLIKHLRTTVTSTTGEDYETYYGEWYDEVVPRGKRVYP